MRQWSSGLILLRPYELKLHAKEQQVMTAISHARWRLSIPIVLILLALIVSLVFTLAAKGFTQAASKPLVQLSSDPYTNKTSQHMTEVEPDTFAFGNTVVSAFQVGRFWNGGSNNIGFATSTNGGKTYTNGFLPGVTVFSNPPGPYARASDPSVAFDSKHNVWLISELGLKVGVVSPSQPLAPTFVDVLVNRSTDGGLTWQPAVVVAKGNGIAGALDKNWTTCDNTPTSPFFGHCYTEFDVGATNLILNSTSTDGGLTWGPPVPTANHDIGIGGQPLVQPNGRVVVPIVGETNNEGVILPANQPFNQKSYISTDGGKSWSATVIISRSPIHVPQGIRATIPLPSAEVDASGTVYDVWSDCRFQTGCFLNDLVLSTSKDGIHWTQPALIPIDPIGRHVDHFIPGLAVDRTTSGSSAHLALTFYFFGHINGVTGNCQTLTCQLQVGFIDSVNGGQSWSTKQVLAGPMALRWLALTTQGYMVGDYISTSIIPGDDDATPAFEVATPPVTPPGARSGTCVTVNVVCNEATFTTPDDLLKITGGTNTSGNPAASFPADGATPKSLKPVTSF
jgi:hypothetical protein